MGGMKSEIADHATDAKAIGKMLRAYHGFMTNVWDNCVAVRHTCV